MKWLWRFTNYIVTWREHRKVIKELNTYTDRQLRDIGINRADIDRLVWMKEDKERRGEKQ